jgi:hypothetical protein
VEPSHWRIIKDLTGLTGSWRGHSVECVAFSLHRRLLAVAAEY